MGIISGSSTGLMIADSQEIDTNGQGWSPKGPKTRSWTYMPHISTSGGEGKGDGSSRTTRGGLGISGSQHTRGELASLISHHLRSPLTFILGYADIAAQQPDGSNQQAIHSILRHATQLREVVDDLTPLLEWYLAQIPHSPYADLCLQTTEVVSSLTMRAEEKGIHFELDLPSRPVLVAADKWGVGVLLTLLLNRLVKQLPEGARLRLCAEQRNTEGILTIEGSENIDWAGHQDGIDPGTIQTMAGVLGGCLDVDSTVGDGFRLLLVFPLRGSDARQ